MVPNHQEMENTQKITSCGHPMSVFSWFEPWFRNDRRQARKHLELPPIWIEEQQNQIRSLEICQISPLHGVKTEEMAVPFDRRSMVLGPWTWSIDVHDDVHSQSQKLNPIYWDPWRCIDALRKKLQMENKPT